MTCDWHFSSVKVFSDVQLLYLYLFTFVCSLVMETVSVPLLNGQLEHTTVSDVNINKHMLPQSQCSLVDSLLFCVFSLSFKSSAHHILSETTLTLTVWQCKMCKIHMGCFTNLDWTSSHNFVWIVPDLLGTFGHTQTVNSQTMTKIKIKKKPCQKLFS